MIKLLWISQSIPQKNVRHAGGKTFQYYFKQLCMDNRFDVSLIAINDSPDDDESELMDINCIVINKTKSYLRRVKNIESRLNPWNKYAGTTSNYLANQVINAAERLKKNGYSPDVVILEWTSMLLCIKDIQKIFPKAKFVSSEHDVTFIGYDRKRKYYKGLKHIIWNQRYNHEKKLELDALKSCNLIMVHNPDNKRVLVENGIIRENIGWLVPYYHDLSSIRRCPNGRDILFFGAMDRKENSLGALWFINNVVPNIKDLDVRFVVLGNNPLKELQRFECESIHITGFVESIDSYFENSICLVAPLVLGAGIKVKILEALSSGMPVLTNSIGIEGIPAVKGRDYFDCETAEDYLLNIYNIMEQKVYCNENAKKFISNTYNMEISAKQYINELINLTSDIS